MWPLLEIDPDLVEVRKGVPRVAMWPLLKSAWFSESTISICVPRVAMWPLLILEGVNVVSVDKDRSEGSYVAAPQLAEMLDVTSSLMFRG